MNKKFNEFNKTFGKGGAENKVCRKCGHTCNIVSFSKIFVTRAVENIYVLTVLRRIRLKIMLIGY